MNRRREASSSPQEEEEEEEDDDEEEEANLSPTQLLQLAETHLRLRNFSLCGQYALESQQPNDPNSAFNHRHASQLLAITNILSSPTNYYSILQIDTFSNDLNLIRSQFEYLLLILDPIKDKSSLANEAVNLVREAYGCLSDPAKKAQFDYQLSGQKGGVDGECGGEIDKVGTFWTFCPYCFYMYQYSRVYEGCCLRCQNQICRRAFHGVALNSLPKMELEKGLNFTGFGYFPLGFSKEAGENGGKFDSWSPIVGMFPVKRIKTRAGRVDLNDGNHNYACNPGDKTDFIEILDESDESEYDQGLKGENFGSNVGVNPRKMKRKWVAWNARKLTRRMKNNEATAANGSGGYGDEDEDDEEDCFEDQAVEDGSCFESDDMAFFEENGEIFVGLGPGPDGAL